MLGVLAVLTPEEQHRLFQLRTTSTQSLTYSVRIDQGSEGGECESTRPRLSWELWLQRTIKYLHTTVAHIHTHKRESGIMYQV